jgi:hypothetical protein
MKTIRLAAAAAASLATATPLAAHTFTTEAGTEQQVALSATHKAAATARLRARSKRYYNEDDGYLARRATATFHQVCLPRADRGRVGGFDKHSGSPDVPDCSHIPLVTIELSVSRNDCLIFPLWHWLRSEADIAGLHADFQVLLSGQRRPSGTFVYGRPIFTPAIRRRVSG